jgi:hypothetical protein
VSEVYRKWGRSVRREGDRLVKVDEAGEAIDDGGLFRTRAIEETVDLPPPDAKSVDAAVREIESIIKPPLIVERLFVSEGVVAHECDGIQWNETSRRVHISIARPPIRALIDLAEFRFAVVDRIAKALLRAGEERVVPRRIRLAEHVGAALLPSVKVGKSQTAAPHDGKGQPIADRLVRLEEPMNWFRPSYRLRPRRAWFHLRIDAFGRFDPEVPEAVALLAPIGDRVMHVLCIDGDRVFPTAVQIGRIVAARPTSIWYPYGAGAFGAEMML